MTSAMPRWSRLQIAALAAVGVVLLLLPQVVDTYSMRLVTRIMVVGLFALSLDLLVGTVGLVSLGHAAFYGVAAYVVALMINKAGVTAAEILLPASLGAAALAALAIGALSIRTAGVYFIMITLALAQMIYYFVKDQRAWGGTDGMNVMGRPEFAWLPLLDLNNRVHFYYFTFACLAAAFTLVAVILHAPFGRALVGIRANEARMRAIGTDVQRVKLMAFVLAGTLAGLAGFLEAARTTFVNPAHLSWHESGHVLMVVILGGLGTLWGPIAGAFALLFLEDWLATLTERWLLIEGVFIIAVVLFLPRGLAGLIQGRWR